MSLRILIADDEKPARFGLVKALTRPGVDIVEAEDGQSAVAAIRAGAPHLVFLDLNMPVLDGQSVLRELGPAVRDCEIVIVTADDSIPAAVECMRLGAADYVTKPYEIERLRAMLQRVARRLEMQDRVDELQARVDDTHACGALAGVSRPMRQLFGQIARAARAPSDILIRGETGTGKELIARELHRQSARTGGPFVAVNTAAITESLAESELFGHARGAFTGAAADRKGVFEQAHGGTLFLDEIGDMPAQAQTKILRVLQERAIQPVGTAHTIPIDVRVISATHQDLEQAIALGRFRRDLYYRIRGIELRAPPLRERREDILFLASYFLERVASRSSGSVRQLGPDAMDSMLAYAWPGNVRELEQAVCAAAAMSDGAAVSAADLNLPSSRRKQQDLQFGELIDLPLTEAKERLIEAFERAAIAMALEKHGGNVSAAARHLGIHRQNLQQKMAQWEIGRPRSCEL